MVRIAIEPSAHLAVADVLSAVKCSFPPGLYRHFEKKASQKRDALAKGLRNPALEFVRKTRLSFLKTGQVLSINLKSPNRLIQMKNLMLTVNLLKWAKNKSSGSV